MSNEERIRKFIAKRPASKAVYGYGSGIFKQAGYSKEDKPQLDLIFVVDDVKAWNEENIQKNPNDYSKAGAKYFQKHSGDVLAGKTGITYLSYIEEDGATFKYGTVEYASLKEALMTWQSFYLTGRFQKTIYEFASFKELQELILNNRRSAVIVSLLMSRDGCSYKDLLVRLCGLSYAGDTRMAIAENPRKVLNIVEGSYEEYVKMYDAWIKEFATVKNDTLKIKKKKLLVAVADLPSKIKEHILSSGEDLNDPSKCEELIMGYLSKINKEESTYQTIKGLKTNGFSKSLSYALAKVKKRFKK